MGLYYNPPSPHIGARQPLEPPKIVPPSGPTPQNPPFVGGAQVSLPVLIQWIPPPPNPNLGEQQPLSPNIIVPPISGPTPQNPPFMGGAEVPQSVLDWWVPPPWPIAMMEQFYAPVDLVPPQSGPSPTNPPVIGAKIPSAVLTDWLPPAPQPIVATLLNPPISGPVAYVPPPVVPPTWPAVTWQPPQPYSFTASGPAPQNPPFAGGAKVPLPILVWSIPPPWPMTVSQQPYAPTVSPPAAPSTQPPPISGGALISLSILDWWVPPPWPQAIQTFLNPTVTGSPAAPTVYVVHSFPTPIVVVAKSGQATYVDFTTVVAATSVTISVPTPQSLLSILDWWVPQAPTVQLPVVLTLGLAAAAIVPPPGSIGAQLSWPPPTWQAPARPALTPSGPSPQNPPVAGGSVVGQPILDWWVPPPWPPVVAEQPYAPEILIPPIAAPTPPLPPLAITWPPVSWQPPVQQLTPVPSYVPPTAATIIWPTVSWQPPSPYVFTASAPVSYVPPQQLAIAWPLQTWQPPARYTITASGPSPQNPPFPGSQVPAAVLDAWIALPPAVVLPTYAPQIAPYVPPIALAITWPVTTWQPSAPYVFTASGPSPQNPPLVGGAKLPAGLLVSWLPPAPQPPQSGPIPLPTTVVAVYVPPSSQLIAALNWWNLPLQAVTLVMPSVLGTTYIPPSPPAITWQIVTWQPPAPYAFTASGPIPVYVPPPALITQWPPVWWPAQRADSFTPSGPVPQSPPTRSLVDQVAISWLPDLSWSLALLVRPSAVVFKPFQPFLGLDPRFITLPQPRITATYGATRVYVTF